MHRKLWTITLAVLFCVSAVAADRVGIFVDTYSGEDIDAENESYCIRDGEKIPITEGMSVFEGDQIVTEKTNGYSIAFLDSSTMTVRPASSVKIEAYGYPAKLAPTQINVQTGTAFFSAEARPDTAHFFVNLPLGRSVEVKSASLASAEAQVAAREIDPVSGRRVAPGSAKFEVVASPASPTPVLSVAVTAGTVSLVSNGIGVDIKVGTQLVYSVASQNGLVPPPLPHDLSAGNLSPTDIKALAKNSLSDAKVSVTNGKVTVASTIHNPDGTLSTSTLKATNGVLTSLKSTTKDSTGRTIETVTETPKGIVKSEQIPGGGFLKTSTITGKGSIKIPGSPVIKGTVTPGPNGGYSFVGFGKNGAELTYTETIGNDGTVTVNSTLTLNGIVTKIIKVTAPDGTVTTTTNGVPATPIKPVHQAAPPATTPGDPSPVSR